MNQEDGTNKLRASKVIPSLGGAATSSMDSTAKAAEQSLNDGLQTDAAEYYLLESLEEKGRRTIPNGDGFRPAVEGERAPLGLNTLGRAFDEEAPVATSSAPRFRNMAQLARQRSQRSFQSADEQQTNGNLSNSIPLNNQKRVQSLLESINDNEEENFNSMEGDGLFRGAPMEIDVDESRDPLFDETIDDYSSAQHQRLLAARRNGPRPRFQWNLACLNPLEFIKVLLQVTLVPFFVWAVPLFIISWILFEYAGNPELDFMPGEATVSWWLSFFGQHVILLQLSYILQALLIDCIILSTRLVSVIVGPWAALFCLQSRGWPFLVGCWGILAMVFLHGDDAFSQHWLYFTGMKIFTASNSGSYIIASNAYLRVLIGMVLAGAITSLKRTFVTLYFGKRSFDIYKTKLEKLLNKVILVSEVAELSAAASDIPLTDSKRSDATPVSDRRSGLGLGVRWASLRFEDGKTMKNAPGDVIQEKDDLDNDEDGEDDDSDGSDSSYDSDRAGIKKGGRKQDKGKEIEDQINSDRRANRTPFTKSYSTLSLDTSVKHFKIKNLLGRWDDPLNKMDTGSNSSVSDILKFRKALTYMDLEHPFSDSFGPAATRDELLTSSQAVYSRLRQLAEGSSILPFSVLAVLAENDDGTIDKQKQKSLKKTFPPDRSGNVSLLAFVSGCDSVYKKLRYFRASVGNASVIDKVLENIVDTVFFFGLTVLILALLNLNPWPLLVSTTTLLVTFAFAVGPSAQTAIEGMILIVGRRPYDIGDRIIISDSPGGSPPGVGESWFVEDITLFSTTLRFGHTNEVATVSNGSISQARITNCARSKNANVRLEMRFHIRLHEGSNLSDFREALDAYVLNNPNRWNSINYFRCQEIDTDNEFLTYRLVTRSTQSWQPASRVLEHRAQLHRFCLDLAIKMGVQYEAPILARVVYNGGEMLDASDPKVNRARDRQESIGSVR